MHQAKSRKIKQSKQARQAMQAGDKAATGVHRAKSRKTKQSKQARKQSKQHQGGDKGATSEIPENRPGKARKLSERRRWAATGVGTPSDISENPTNCFALCEESENP